MSTDDGDSGATGGAPRTVVFDLDGTLVAGDSYSAFVRTTVIRHPGRRVAALLAAPLWLPALRLRWARPSAERFLVWLAGAGMDDAAFATAARDFAAEHAGVAGGRVVAAALERVREHRDRGDRVIVATGCAAPLAHEICSVIGLEGIEVLTSTVTRRRWGPPVRVLPARGHGKVALLRAAGVPLPVDHAYSDSVVDLPLLLHARTAHVVDPTPRDWRRLRRALGSDVDLLRWRTS
jgi:phosphatidylglycerophosphatase C